MTSSAVNKGTVWQLGQQFTWKIVQESLPAQPESNGIHPTESHGLSELCMLPEWHSCPGRAPGSACWHSGVSCRACLRDQSTSNALLYPSCCREWREKKQEETADQYLTFSLVSLAVFREVFLAVGQFTGHQGCWIRWGTPVSKVVWSCSAVPQAPRAPASFCNAEVCRAETIHSLVLAQLHSWTLRHYSEHG